MPKNSVEKLLKSHGKIVVKNVFDFPQAFNGFFLKIRNAWKTYSYSPYFPGLPQFKFTGDFQLFLSYEQKGFHNFHSAYYYDDYIFNKKGIA